MVSKKQEDVQVESETPETERRKVMRQNHFLLFLALPGHQETESGRTSTKHSQLPGTPVLRTAGGLHAERQQVSLHVMNSVIYI